jgi:hypothetical protein
MRSHLGHDERSYRERHRFKRGPTTYRNVRRRRSFLEQLECRASLAINVNGKITSNTISSCPAQQYSLTGGLAVRGGVTSIIESGVKVRTDSLSIDISANDVRGATGLKFIDNETEPMSSQRGSS